MEKHVVEFKLKINKGLGGIHIVAPSITGL